MTHKKVSKIQVLNCVSLTSENKELKI